MWCGVVLKRLVCVERRFSDRDRVSMVAAAPGASLSSIPEKFEVATWVPTPEASLPCRGSTVGKHVSHVPKTEV